MLFFISYVLPIAIGGDHNANKIHSHSLRRLYIVIPAIVNSLAFIVWLYVVYSLIVILSLFCKW